MKLLLTSEGITNKSIADAFLELAGKPFNQLKLAYIPTAANTAVGDKKWVIDHMARTKELGFAFIDIVDISALTKDQWEPRLEGVDVLLFEGGSPVGLMNSIRKSGLDKLLPEFLRTKVYVGQSAGSMVATPSLSIKHTEILYDPQVVDKNQKENGLGLVGFQIRPHLNSPDFPKVNHEILKKLAKDVSKTIYALDDNSAIKVDGEKVEVVSEGKWEKFN